MSQPPLRDPFAEPSAPSSSSTLSLGASRSRRRPPQPLASTSTLTGLELRKRNEDDSIRSTDNDALTSRLSAMQSGYLDKEDFSPLFAGGGGAVPGAIGNFRGIPQSSYGSPPSIANLNPPPTLRRPPIINIGTYLRCTGVDALVEAFLTAGDDVPKQIVSLGAGSDARYWRIRTISHLAQRLGHYLELDFPMVASRKIAAIDHHARLRSGLEGRVAISGGDHESATSSTDAAAERLSAKPPSLWSERYSIHGLDLRLLDGHLREILAAHLDPQRPTLILAECVLSYIAAPESQRLLSLIADSIEPQAAAVAAVSYEMCIAGDVGKNGVSEGTDQVGQFGRVMLRNLETRGLSLQGARAYTTPSSHERRFSEALTRAGASVQCGSRSLSRIWLESLSDSRRNRLRRIEGLDEVEELRLLLGSYALAWACREPASGSEGANRDHTGHSISKALDESIRMLSL